MGVKGLKKLVYKFSPHKCIISTEELLCQKSVQKLIDSDSGPIDKQQFEMELLNYDDSLEAADSGDIINSSGDS